MKTSSSWFMQHTVLVSTRRKKKIIPLLMDKGFNVQIDRTTIQLNSASPVWLTVKQSQHETERRKSAFRNINQYCIWSIYQFQIAVLHQGITHQITSTEMVIKPLWNSFSLFGCSEVQMLHKKSSISTVSLTKHTAEKPSTPHQS